MKDIFISHSSKDALITEKFIDLILIGGLAIDRNRILCSSIDGTKIKSGTDWRNSLKKALLQTKIAFILISDNYNNSQICQNELGAIWIKDGITTIPLVIHQNSNESVGILQEINQIEKISEEGSLDRIKDIIEDSLKVPFGTIKSDNWSRVKNNFFEEIENIPDTFSNESIDKKQCISIDIGKLYYILEDFKPIAHSYNQAVKGKKLKDYFSNIQSFVVHNKNLLHVKYDGSLIECLDDLSRIVSFDSSFDGNYGASKLHSVFVNAIDYLLSIGMKGVRKYDEYSKNMSSYEITGWLVMNFEEVKLLNDISYKKNGKIIDVMIQILEYLIKISLNQSTNNFENNINYFIIEMFKPVFLSKFNISFPDPKEDLEEYWYITDQTKNL